MKPVSLDEYQRDALRTYPYELMLSERRDWAAMKLVEEAAEFMALVNKAHYQGGKYDKQRLKEELGDVLWALTINLLEYDFSLEELLEDNLAKRNTRYPRK